MLLMSEPGEFASPKHPGAKKSWLWRGGIAATALLGSVLFGPAEAAGTLKPFAYHSDALNEDQVAQVYVPEGEAPDDGWPVLYLLHGLHGKPTDWATYGDIRTLLDRMIAQKQIKPLLVVMPDGQNSWYVDSAAVGGPGNYYTAISHDLEQAVEKAFPVGRDRLHRAVAGYSMGGFGALRLALSEPDRYAAVGAMSPAIWQNTPVPPPANVSSGITYFQHRDPTTVTVGAVAPPDGDHFGAAFGIPFDPKRFDDANVFTLLQRDIDAKKLLPAVYVTVGDDDSHLLWRGAIAFFETMQADRKFLEFRITDGDHTWSCWKASLGDIIVFVDRNLNRVPIR